MTLDLLKQIITKVESLGFKIQGITMDLGNKTILSQLGFNDGKYWFPNPVDASRKVFIFPGTY